MVNLNPIIGSEQAGVRPAVVVSEESFNKALLKCTLCQGQCGFLYSNQNGAPHSIPSFCFWYC